MKTESNSFVTYFVAILVAIIVVIYNFNKLKNTEGLEFIFGSSSTL